MATVLPPRSKLVFTVNGCSSVSVTNFYAGLAAVVNSLAAGASPAAALAAGYVYAGVNPASGPTFVTAVLVALSPQLGEGFYPIGLSPTAGAAAYAALGGIPGGIRNPAKGYTFVPAAKRLVNRLYRATVAYIKAGNFSFNYTGGDFTFIYT